jgi:tetratricopeptide (TPR) repeat protein
MVRQRPPDHIPRDVLARSDFVEACGQRDLGKMFRIAGKWGGAGFTPSHLSRRCEMTVTQVQDYTLRGRQALTLDVIERVADGLHIPGRMLALGDRPWERQADDGIPRDLTESRGDPASSSLETTGFSAPWTVDGTLVTAHEVSEVSPVDRRSFLLLTGAALTTPAHEWLIARPLDDVSRSAGRKIEPRFVDSLDDITAKLRRMDDQMGGGALIDLVQAQISFVARLLREGRYTDSLGRRLHGTLGELLRLGGWVSYDDGNLAQAQRFWISSLHAAHTAGDTALGANVLGFMSEPAWNLGRPDDAAKLTATALAGYRGKSPHVSAILHMRAALPFAIKGDGLDCKRAIDTAYSAFRNSPPASGEPDWSYWMDEGSLNEQIGICLISLGDYQSACNHLERSLQVEQNGQIREGVVRQTYLATAYVRRGEPERACEIGMLAADALSTQVDSPRLTARVQALGDDLQPYKHIDAVRELTERVDTLGMRNRG